MRRALADLCLAVAFAPWASRRVTQVALTWFYRLVPLEDSQGLWGGSGHG